MISVILAACLLATGAEPEGAADIITLKDGKVLLGQLPEPDRRGGPIRVVARRAWVEANLPDRFDAWRKVEDPITRRAQTQRQARLAAWRRDRPQPAAAGDRISAWLDASIRPPGAGPEPPARLMVVRLNRGDIKAAVRRPARIGRLLRLGWTLDLPDVEAMPLDALRGAVEARGFAPDLDTPVPLDAFLPPAVETDERWLLRRAATEAANDEGNRFLRFQGMVLPEPKPGEPLPASAGLGTATEMLKNLLGEAPAEDPMAARLREAGTRGKAGVVVSALELAPDLSSVAVTVGLWVRVGGPDRWVLGLARTGSTRGAEVPAQAGERLAEDPQVKAVFNVVEGLGLGDMAELKAKGLAMGAATQTALIRARAAIDPELNALALPLDPPAGADPAEKAAPKP